jgi:hypothetical protein
MECMECGRILHDVAWLVMVRPDGVVIRLPVCGEDDTCALRLAPGETATAVRIERDDPVTGREWRML